MKTKIEFTTVNLAELPRGEVFYYFSKMAPTGYSITTEIDITKLLAVLRASGLKFFPAYLWLVTKTLNEQPEFRMALKDGTLGYYNTLTPLYAAFHDDTKTFSLMWTEFDDCFSAFYNTYLQDKNAYSETRGILAKPGQVPPPNAYTVSCVPWISFKHFAVHSYEKSDYFFPSVEAGKYYEKDERTILPLSLTCHHAAADGWHVHLFLETLQKHADNFDKFLDL